MIGNRTSKISIDQCIQLSIIIPHFNSGDLLDKLLSSILSECRDDTQIIVVDDNSTEMIDEYISCKNSYSDRVEFYTSDNKTNSAGACRNIGIEHAKGKWLLFCDADDYLLPGWYNIITGYYNSDNDVIFFPPKAVKLHTDIPSSRGDELQRLLTNYIDGKKGSEILLRTRFFSPCSKLIKNEFVCNQNIRFDLTMYANDVMFSTKLGLAMQFFDVSKESIYCITEGTTSLTKRKNRDSLLIRTEVAARRLKYIKDRISYKEWLQTQFGVIPIQYVFDSMQRGYGIGCTKCVIIAFRTHKVPIIAIDSFLYYIIFYYLKKLLLNR